jgi:DNA helicase MCM8
MEQQQVSIAKAGVVASLPARCSVIAAANPKNGSYNLDKTVAENLNTAKPILSRFDLVFILRDRADKEQDQLVSSNIINLYRNPNRAKSSAATAPTPGAAAHASHAAHCGISNVAPCDDGTENQRLPLRQRLAWVHDFQKEPLPASLVRDYIAYAREYCKPKLTPEAAIVLKDYYMQLRYVPRCTRQICFPLPAWKAPSLSTSHPPNRRSAHD